MRNQEAARYARWAAAVAALIAVTAGIFYFSRQIRQAHARRHGPKDVPASVEQQSAEFAFSKVEKDRTIYTVQASRATQFTGGDSSLLEDVTITFFGSEGDRNDVLHTHECNYDRISGGIRCQGSVEIHIQAAANAASAIPMASSGKSDNSSPKSAPPPRTLVVNTSDVAFNRETGVATTKQSVTFRLPNADGHATGVNYNSRNGTLQLQRDVEMRVCDLKNPASPPVVFTGTTFTYDRDVRIARLEGGARATQGNRELTARALVLELDQRMHAKRAFAEGNPLIRMNDNTQNLTGRAERFEASLNEAGWIENVGATNNVFFEKKSGQSTEKLTAQSVQLLMEPQINQPREMQALGKVKLQTETPSGSDRLETSQFTASFVAGLRPSQRRIDSVDFPSRAVAHLNAKDGVMTIETHRGTAKFDAQNHIQSFEGDSGVQITRKPLTGELQQINAQRMTASFDSQGKWNTVILDSSSGAGLGERVHFVQADRQAYAQHAQIINATNTIVLTGNASVSDSSSRTTAEKFEIEQQTGEVSGFGGVHTEVLSGQGTHNAAAQSPAFLTADRLEGSTTQGHLSYSGHARMWQGDAVLDADTIDLWRGDQRPLQDNDRSTDKYDDQRIDARGNVVAVFPQAPSKESAVAAKQSGSPVLWKIQAPQMQYWNIQGRAHLEGGVSAQSQDQSLTSQTFDIFLSSASPSSSPHTSKPAPPSKNAPPAIGSRQLTRAVATGSVVIRQGERRGTGERAEYTASDQKFVLSGGSPTVTDAADQTITAGRSLTFYRASDTVSVDSENGSRTLTKHRVEK